MNPHFFRWPKRLELQPVGVFDTSIGCVGCVCVSGRHFAGCRPKNTKSRRGRGTK